MRRKKKQICKRLFIFFYEFIKVINLLMFNPRILYIYHLRFIAMNFQEDFPPEQIDQRYEALLSQYTKLKEELNVIGSEKQLDIEYDKLSRSLKDVGVINVQPVAQDNSEEITLKQEIQRQISRANDIRNKFDQSHRQIQDKIQKKKLALGSSSNPQSLAKKSALSGEKQQILKQIAKISDELSGNSKSILTIQADQKAAEQKNSFLLVEQQKNNQRGEQTKTEIENLKGESKKLQNTLKDIRAEIERLNKPESGSKQNSQSSVGDQITKLTQKIKQQKEDNDKLVKQLATEKQSLKSAEKASKQSADKQSDLKKQLEQNKESEQKIRKLIEAHASQIKRITEDKRDKKTKQAEANAELQKFENECKYLQKSISWEVKKIEDFKQLKKTYIKRKELEGLQQKKKTLDKSNKNSEASNIELGKLTKKLNEVTESVNKIKKQKTKTINQKQNQVKQLKQRRDELKKKKQQSQKNFNQSKAKLEDYKKQYPDHELNKIKQLEEEKKRKAEIARAKQIENATRKLEQQNKKKLAKQENTEEEDIKKYLPPVTVEERSLSTMLSNPTVQYAGIGALVLILLVVYYAL